MTAHDFFLLLPLLFEVIGLAMVVNGATRKIENPENLADVTHTSAYVKSLVLATRDYLAGIIFINMGLAWMIYGAVR